MQWSSEFKTFIRYQNTAVKIIGSYTYVMFFKTGFSVRTKLKTRDIMSFDAIIIRVYCFMNEDTNLFAFTWRKFSHQKNISYVLD